MSKSSITNCYIHNRPQDSEWLIKENPTGDGSVFLRLDHYALVPLELYEDENTMRNVRQLVEKMKEAHSHE